MLRQTALILGFILGLCVPAQAQFPKDRPPLPDLMDNGNAEYEYKPYEPPKTLWEWAIGKEEEENGNGEEEEEDTIVTDRPDFTEASSTVGKGRIQLEAGYTFIRDRENGTRFTAHSYPEMLWRIGMFAEWFELRIVQNFVSERVSGPDASENNSGAEDFLIGCKIALLEQKGCLPEVGIILQITVPSGADEFSAKEVLPGFSLLYSWEIIPGKLAFGANTLANRARGNHTLAAFPEAVFLDPDAADTEVDHSFIELAQSASFAFTVTDKFGFYTEYFGIIPHSALDPDLGPAHFFNGGFTYLVTNNFQLDIRAGVGLNKHAEDFFAGAGFSARY